MIEGLKVTVGGEELKGLCIKRAAHHSNRAVVCREQAEVLKKNEVEGNPYKTGGNPVEEMIEKAKSHEADSAELLFIADHVALSETYLLGREDLRRLGIVVKAY